MAAAPEVFAALGLDGCEIVETLPLNWHGDGHWRTRDRHGREYSVRAIGAGRSVRVEESRPYDERTLSAQLRVAGALRTAGVPMMQLLSGPVELDGCIAVAFGWIKGELATVATPDRAVAIGRLLALLHEAALPTDDALPVHDVSAAARQGLQRLRDHFDGPFLDRATAIVERAAIGDAHRTVSHGDCNFPNVLWDGDDIVGLVDLDQIGVIEPLEELAYVVKWWSRPQGMEVRAHDAVLAAAVIDGYGTAVDCERLADLLWLTGCLNANSVEHILRASPADRPAVVTALEHRADTLARLVV